MTDHELNWAGNFEFSTNRVHFPETVPQVQAVVARTPKLRVLGSRHSFNRIADSEHELVSLEKLSRLIELDRDNATVTVSAGIRYGDICQVLSDAGFALHNMASLPHISIAGACATATHGSGVRNGNLATAVSAMEIVSAAGEVLTFSRANDGDLFAGMVVGLGGLGAVTKVTLDVVPLFDVQQVVYENLPLSQLAEHFDSIVSGAYSVSLFTELRGDVVDRMWFKHRVSDDPDRSWPEQLYGATRAAADLHPIAGHSAESCTPQMAVAGPWHDRLPHFRMAFTPSSGKELQTEYFVPREHWLEAVLAVNNLRDVIAPLLMVSEIRTIAADDLWMSPAYKRDSLAIHFTWRQDWPGVRQVLPLIEEALSPFDARPHWGKLFTMSPEQVQGSYARLGDFRELLGRMDPEGKFRNTFMDTYIFGS